MGFQVKTALVFIDHYSYHYKKNTQPYLELSTRHMGPSEIGSLFLLPDYRSNNLGRLLSLSRFLFIKAHQSFFTDTIIAELRGFFFNNNVSPIWNAIGKQFLRMPFNQADQLSVKDPDFLPSKFPKMPIYTHLLDPQATKFLGQVHPNTKPALRLLTSENFSITNQIDIFDGGPILNCNTTDCQRFNNPKRFV